MDPALNRPVDRIQVVPHHRRRDRGTGRDDGGERDPGMSVHTEAAFESNIEAHLLARGWLKLDPTSYDTNLGLFGDEVVAYVQISQPKAWQQLVTRHGG